MNSKDYKIGLLKSYDYLSGYIEQADFCIYNKALGTHNFGCAVKEDTKIQVESIIRLIRQKNQLLNIYNVLTKALNGVEEHERKIIVWRYVKGVSVKQLMQKLELNKGAYYDRINKALNNFEKILQKEGFDRGWFLENYSTKRWFRRLIDFTNEAG